jgi:addiction module RelE/StbE family toxin
MEVVASHRFKKQYRKLSRAMQRQVGACLETFVRDPFDPELNNHGLKGEYQECRSLNVNGDFRIVYRDVGTHYRLVAIGTHSELYRK